MNKRKEKTLSIILTGIALLIMIGVTIWLFPWVTSLMNATAREAFIQKVHDAGIWGFLMVLGIQVLQIVFAIIPGEPLEIIAGALYGVWGGTALCLLGVGIGSAIVFALVKKFGMKLVRIWVSEEKLNKLSFLQNRQRLLFTTFLLFFIPGTPKDALTYVAGLTPIKPLTFILVSSIARIPSVVTSVWAGAYLGTGNWLHSAILFGIAGLLAVIGIIVHKKWMQRMEKKPA